MEILFVQPDRFVSHVPGVAMTKFYDFTIEWNEAVNLTPRLRAGLDPHILLRGAICGYAARTSGYGIVMGRALLKASLTVVDAELLKLAIDPEPEIYLASLDGIGRDAPLWRARPADDPDAMRIQGHRWWHAVEGHGTVIHKVESQHDTALEMLTETAIDMPRENRIEHARERRFEIDQMARSQRYEA